MSNTENESIIQCYFNDIWNSGQFDLVEKIISPDYVNHGNESYTQVTDRDFLKSVIQEMRRGFPDLRFTIDDLIIDKTKVAVRCHMKGTHTGSLFGIQPTGKEVIIHQIQIERIQDGMMIEHWRQSTDVKVIHELAKV